ncbi:MFS transporter [Candidatus Bathyarchaeota archaeon]|nr:MFS transporter [Candidatus Bathyarchaeota archaeon]
MSVNLFFAGILAWLYPILDSALHRVEKPEDNPPGGGGALGLFAGFNVVAFVLVYLFVEETKQRSLEDLEQIYNVPKRRFVRFQATVHLPWFLKRWFLCSDEKKPDFYEDDTKHVTRPAQEMIDMSPPGSPVVLSAQQDKGPQDPVGDGRPGSRGRYE